MITLTDTARLLSYRALEPSNRGSVQARLMSSLAKKGYAPEAAIRVTSNATQDHRAMGLSEKLPLKRYFRNARPWTIPDEATGIQKLEVCNEALAIPAYVMM